MVHLNTKYNKTNVNIVAAFLGTIAVWILNKYAHADIPVEIAQASQGFLQVVLTWLIPNAEG